MFLTTLLRDLIENGFNLKHAILNAATSSTRILNPNSHIDASHYRVLWEFLHINSMALN